MEPGRDDREVELVVVVGERLGVLELLSGFWIEVRDRDVGESTLLERRAVERAAGDDEHPGRPRQPTLVDERREHAPVEALPFVHDRLPIFPRR
jgi:hypothetical protein